MSRRLTFVLAGLALVTTGGPSRAEESERAVGAPSEQIGVTGSAEAPKEVPERPPPSSGDAVGLDRLLQLPSSMSFNAERRQGATADEWRARFRASQRAIQEAKDAVDRTRSEMDELSGSGGGGNWQVAPPGSNQTENTPMSFKLREALRRYRAELDEAERSQRALIVEADLAGVPENWRRGS